MRFVRVLGMVLAGVVGLLLLLTIAARFSDGPIAIIAGGPLESGELVTGDEPEWSFARDINTIEFQLLEPARSRTSWILEHRGKIYVPCGYMDSAVGRFWKKWPIEAAADGRAIARIEGKRYPRRLVRVGDEKLFGELTAEIERKYGVPSSGATIDAGGLWIFELAPRQSDVATPGA